MNKLLVTGGLGFIGRAVLRLLRNEDFPSIIVLDDRSIPQSDDTSWIEKDFIVHSRSASDVDAIASILDGEINEGHPVTHILSLASLQGYGKHLSKMLPVNLGLAYSMRAAIEALDEEDRPKAHLQISSQARYRPLSPRNASSQGVDHVGGMQFTDELLPPSLYGQTKRWQEEVFRSLSEDLHVPTVSLRLPIVLGPGQALSKGESGLLRNWFRSYMNGEPCEIYGDGTQIRDFIHVEDAALSICDLMLGIETISKCESRLWSYRNVPGIKASVRDVAYEFMMATGYGEFIEVEPQRPGGEFSMFFNCSKYHIEDKRSIRTMVTDFVSFSKKHLGVP